MVLERLTEGSVLASAPVGPALAGFARGASRTYSSMVARKSGGRDCRVWSEGGVTMGRASKEDHGTTCKPTSSVINRD